MSKQIATKNCIECVRGKILSMATQDIFLLLTMVQKLKQRLTLAGYMDCIVVLIMRIKE